MKRKYLRKREKLQKKAKAQAQEREIPVKEDKPPEGTDPVSTEPLPLKNFVYFHPQDEDDIMEPTEEITKAHVFKNAEGKDVIAFPLCHLCGCALSPMIELEPDERGIVETCPFMPALIDEHTTLLRKLATPKNAECPCGSGKVYKRCCGMQ